MPATPSQTIANRLNALKSTGPRTEQGKARSSRNATSHGLSRLGATPPSAMADAIADRKEQWLASYRPEGPAQDWLFERLCAESVRLDSCERRLIALRAELADRAAEAWDDDRAALVAEQADALSRRPEVVQPRLLQTRHGVLWLIGRWDEVADSLRRCEGWRPDTWDLAMDLLGASKAARVGSGPWDLHPEDAGPGPGLELVRSVVEALRARLASHLDDRDARARSDAELGLGLGLDDAPPIRLLERYARDARLQISRCLDGLRRLQAEAEAARAPDQARSNPAPSPSPTPVPPPRPVRAPAPRPTAPPAAVAPGGADAFPAEAHPEPPAPRATPAAGPLSSTLRDRLSPSPSGPNRRARRAALAASRRS
ncbi:hypothetical protein [Tautonia plasticadhaerens]|uniref:Uncharacterized protein n=1 Tax=Tautonia plasticadhaerens TaxID=2527974 RepID=A0A518H5E9_9BACT|nr:hypothetical protein [Tautonia plasticadhaerens]QDV36053.1 hypothetical protein ElP_39630 [Tautonia plasticadhaerens]